MKKIQFIIILGLVILNIILCIKLWGYKVRKTQDINYESISELMFLNSSLTENLDLSINPFQQVIKENDTSYILLNSLINQPKLIFYYNEMSCTPCTDLELAKLDSLSKIIGPENVILLTKHTSAKSIYLLKRANSLKLKVIFIDARLDIPISNFQTNFYFILDKDFKTKFFFVPSKNYPDLSKVYFSRIIRYLRELN